MLLLDFFSKTRHQFFNYLQFFSQTVIWYVKWLINTISILSNVNDDEFFMFPKFWFSSIIWAEVIANKSFSACEPLSPRP